ncbi:MAG TPA: alpha/beta hydrolase, partial [Polyangiaceae bacterium]
MSPRAVLLQLLSLLVGAPGCGSDTREVVALWPEGAPGSEQRRHEAEVAKDWWVANVHHPSLSVVRPKLGTATGAAVIVIPGGGHSQLVFEPEGLAPARYLARHGVTAFALKYRLAKEKGSSYRVEEHALADVRRAVRWVRSKAESYGVDPARVGVMGWSAGGELAALVSY